MDYNLQVIVTVGVIVAAAALCVQMAMLIGIALAIRKLQAQVTQVFPQVEAIIGTTRRTADTIEKHAAKIGENASIIVDVTRQQVVKLDEFLNDATTRAKVQMERAEMVLDDTMGRAQETVSIVQRTVLRPIREVNGVFSGVKATLAHLGRGSRPTVDHATANEEMFI
jgi:hypothetical protein